MPILQARTVRNGLTHGPVALTPASAARGWPRTLAIAGVALLAGAAGTQLYWQDRIGQARQQTQAQEELLQLRHELERAGMTQRVSTARGDELERQVEQLNKSLREREEELAFFRKTRGGSR